MLTCSSLRYAGLLVEAKDCDRDSYVNLGLVCPYCSAPLFWVAPGHKEASFRRLESGKKVLVKEHDIPAHFSHFKDVSQKQVEVCESRAKSVKKKDITSSRASLKRQRKKIFDERIKNLFLFNQRLAGFEYINFLGHEDYLNSLSTNLDQEQKELLWKKQLRGLAIKFKGSKNRLKTLLNKELRVLESNNFKLLDKVKNCTVDAGLDYLSNAIEWKLHKQICQEVFDYLFSSVNYEILAELIWFNLYFAMNCMFFCSEVVSKEDKQLLEYLEHFSNKPEEQDPKVGQKLLDIFAIVPFQGAYFSLPQAIGDRAFNEVSMNVDIFSRLREVKKKGKNDFPFENTTLDLAFNYLLSTIVHTPWADAFEYFDRGSTKPIKLGKSIGFIVVDGTAPVLKLRFVQVKKNQQAERELIDISRQAILTNEIVHYKSGDYEVHLGTLNEFTLKFTIKILKNQELIGTAMGWSSIDPLAEKKDQIVYRLKKDYPELSKAQKSKLKRNPCLLITDYLYSEQEQALKLMTSIAHQIFARAEYALVAREITT